MPDLSQLNKSCAVLVMSCDAYRDLWTPFFSLFFRYWPDCPFPVYLGSNDKQFLDPRVHSLASGHLAWSAGCRLHLNQIEADYILLLLEDYFLDSQVSTQEVLHYLAELDRLGGLLMRLTPLPGPDAKLAGNDRTGRIALGAPYRISTQAALWRKTHLLDILRDDESIWQFEWNGTVRSREFAEGYYGTYHSVVGYRQVVERGKWFWSAARRYRDENIGCDFSARAVMNPAVALKKAINRFRKNTVGSLLRK